MVSQTAHSIRRYNTKTKFNDAQLKQLIDPLLTLIRFDHILPQPNDFLISLQNRQLIGWPNQLHFDDFNALPILSGEGLNSVDSGKEFEGIDSSKALTNRTLNLTASANGFTTTGQSNAGLANHAVIEHLASQIQHWIPSGNAPLNRKPRLFFVYYEEAKSLLEERVGRPGEMINTLKSTVSIHRSHSTSNEPSLPLVSLFSSTCNSSPSTSANCPFHSNTNRAFEDAQCIGDTASEDGEIGGQHRFLCGSLSNSTGAQMPDTLYMVQSSNRWSINEDQLMPANRSHASYRGSSIDERRSVCSNLSDTSSNRLSIVTHELINSSLSNNQFDCTFADAAAINRSILHGSSKSIDPLSQVLIQSLPADRIVQLKQREQNLRTLAIANRHLSALEDKSFFYHLIALRVVREFGLDDCLTVIFRPETLVSIGTGNNFRNRTSSATHSSQLPQPSQSTSSSLTSARHSSTGRTRNTSQLPNEAFAFDSEFDVALDEMDDAVFALSTLNRTVDAARRARQDHLKCV